MTTRDRVLQEVKETFTEEKSDQLNAWLVNWIFSLFELPWYVKPLRGMIRSRILAELDKRTPEKVIELLDGLLLKIGID